MNKRILTIIVSCVIIAAVGLTVAFVRSNNRIPSEKKMSQMLADVYLADAIIQSRGNLYSGAYKSDMTPENLYRTVLGRYNIDKSTFDEAVAWYAVHPEEYARVYEGVVSILSKREGEYGVLLNKRDSIQRIIDEKNDSLRVSFWKGRNLIHIPFQPQDSIKGKDLKFEYALDSLKGGKLNMTMKYVFPRKNEATDEPLVEMIVVYNDTIQDTISCAMTLSHLQHTAELEYALRDTLKAVKLKTNLLKSSQFKKVTATLSEVKITYMPYLITDSVKFDEIQLPPLFAY